MLNEAKFWDNVARKYATDPIKNIAAYNATLDSVRARISTTDNVLEIGCGTGSTALLLADSTGQYTGADVSSEMIKIADEKLADTDITNLSFTIAGTVDTQFKPAQFDAVLGFNILHLVADLDATLARAHTVLKPGGLLITKTPCLREMGFYIPPAIWVMQRLGKAPFVGIFGAPKLEQTVVKAGFKIVESRTFNGAKHARYLVAQKV